LAKGVKSRADERGRHNIDLKASTSRLIQGATWKKQRTIMLIPAGEMIPARVYLNHRCLIFPPNQPAHVMATENLEVGEAFSRAIGDILSEPAVRDWEFLLTIEHDNLPPSDGLVTLIRHMEAHKEFAAIGGLYWTKGEGGVPQIWGDPKDSVANYRPQPPDPAGGLVECCGVGMGFTLFRLAMFKDPQLRRPWFKTVGDSTGVGTQDLYFWSDARKYGYRCAVACDVRVGHYDHEGRFGPPGMVW
jgi:hypothetical protein